MRLSLPFSFYLKRWEALRPPRPWKLVQYFENNDIELYNVEKDIGERHNVASNHPDVSKQLLLLLETWRHAINAPAPSQLNPHYTPLTKPKE